MGKRNPFNPARPADATMFVGRRDITSRLITGLKDSLSYAVIGPAGIGKTSLLWEVQRQLQAHNQKNHHSGIYLPFYVECLHEHVHKKDLLLCLVDSLLKAVSIQAGLTCHQKLVSEMQKRAQEEQDLFSIIDPFSKDFFSRKKRNVLPILLLDDLHRLDRERLAELCSLLYTVVNKKDLFLVLAGRCDLTEELRKDISYLRMLISHNDDELKPFSLAETTELVNKASSAGWHVEDGCAGLAHTLTNGHPYRLHYYLSAVLTAEKRVTKKALNAQHTPGTRASLMRLLGDEQDRHIQPPSFLSETEHQKIRELVRSNELEKALDILGKKGEHQQDADLLSLQLNIINKRDFKGTMKTDEVIAERTRIAEKILILISSLRRI